MDVQTTPFKESDDDEANQFPQADAKTHEEVEEAENETPSIKRQQQENLPTSIHHDNHSSIKICQAPGGNQNTTTQYGIASRLRATSIRINAAPGGNQTEHSQTAITSATRPTSIRILQGPGGCSSLHSGSMVPQEIGSAVTTLATNVESLHINDSRGIRISQPAGGRVSVDNTVLSGFQDKPQESTRAEQVDLLKVLRKAGRPQELRDEMEVDRVEIGEKDLAVFVRGVVLEMVGNSVEIGQRVADRRRQLDSGEEIQELQQDDSGIEEQEKPQQEKEEKNIWKKQKTVAIGGVDQEFSNIFGELWDGPENQDDEKFFGRPYEYPTMLAIDDTLIGPIRKQLEIVNRAGLQFFVKQLDLMKHFKILKGHYFMEAGDFFEAFTSVIFTEFGVNITNDFLGRLNEGWESCSKLGTHDLGSEVGCFRFRNPRKSGTDSESNALAFDASKNPEDIITVDMNSIESFKLVKLNYEVEWPLNLVINEKCLDRYNEIFRVLLAIKRASSVLNTLWKNLTSFQMRNLPKEQYNAIRRFQILRQKMQHFVVILQEYIVAELLGAIWASFMKSVEEVNDIYELLREHDEYLKKAAMCCFIDPKGKKLLENITMTFTVITKFHHLVAKCTTLDEEDILSEQALREFRSIEHNFTQLNRFLYTLAKTLADKGRYPELFLRLDYNEFFTVKIEMESFMMDTL